MAELEFTVDSLYEKPGTLIDSVEVSERRIKITFLSLNGENLVFEYPASWLRLCCECSACYVYANQSTRLELRDAVSEKSDAKNCTVNENGTSLSITWWDEHVSNFKSDWLFIRRFTEEARKDRLNRIHLYPNQNDLWGDNFVPERGSYHDVTTSDEGYKRFAMGLVKDGVFIVENSPLDHDIAEEFMDKINIPIYITHYGKTWRIISESVPDNLAYTHEKLVFHTDLCSLNNTPNIQFLHCIKQSKVGGENMLADGVKAANLLRQRFPDDYKILTQVSIEHEDVQGLPGHPERYLANHKPVIPADNNGDPLMILWTYFTRSSHFLDGDVEVYEKWLDAYMRFDTILNSECQIKLKTKEGEILIFDNRRILHGRESYDSREPRHLEGWYADWDYVMSKLRVITAKENGLLNKIHV